MATTTTATACPAGKTADADGLCVVAARLPSTTGSDNRSLVAIGALLAGAGVCLVAVNRRYRTGRRTTES